MAISSILISPNINTFYFSEAVNNGLNVLGQGDYQSQILQWQNRPQYLQKCLMDDTVTLQFHFFDSVGPTLPILHLCDRWQNVITAADATLAAAPILKGLQSISGNTYTADGATYNLASIMWSFKFSGLSSWVTPDTPTDFYYIKLNVNAKEYFSEPIRIRTAKFDNYGNNVAFPNTLLFNSTYAANRAGNTKVVVSGWFNNYPTNSVPFNPNFYTRVEGSIMQDDPNLIAFEYLIQNYDANFISGQQIERQILMLGIASTGVPNYMLKMITEFMMADKTSVTMGAFNRFGTPLYYQYKIYNPNTGTTPATVWKVQREEGYPLLTATLPLTLGSSNQNAIVDPVPVPSSHIFTSVFTDVFS